jgi:hypothetical protein
MLSTIVLEVIETREPTGWLFAEKRAAKTGKKNQIFQTF